MNLWHVNISDAGICSIAHALKHNAGLKELALCTRSVVADESIALLMESLDTKHNKTLQVLVLTQPMQRRALSHYNYKTMVCRIKEFT